MKTIVDMKRYSVDEFIEFTKTEPYNWINYCEIMILRNGLILLARPSHQECAIYYAMETEDKTRDEILEELRKDYLSPLDFYVDKYKMIAVWYDYLLVSGRQKISRFQEHTLKRLSDSGLISKEHLGIHSSLEYQTYLWRKKELYDHTQKKEEEN